MEEAYICKTTIEFKATACLNNIFLNSGVFSIFGTKVVAGCTQPLYTWDKVWVCSELLLSYSLCKSGYQVSSLPMFCEFFWFIGPFNPGSHDIIGIFQKPWKSCTFSCIYHFQGVAQPPFTSSKNSVPRVSWLSATGTATIYSSHGYSIPKVPPSTPRLIYFWPISPPQAQPLFTIPTSIVFWRYHHSSLHWSIFDPVLCH